MSGGGKLHAAPPQQRVNLESLGALWRASFTAAEVALGAAGGFLPTDDLREDRRRLIEERASTARLLAALARDTGKTDPFLYLLVFPGQARALLGLPTGVTACVFNLEGVLIGSAALHAAAWSETFDKLIQARIEQTGGQFAPFNPSTDYQAHIDGKPRLEGVRAFLASRGISLPEGAPDDEPGAQTVHGLANRKNAVLQRRLEEQGVAAFRGSRRYLEIARDVGLKCAVVSASANTPAIIERSGLAGLIDHSVDGNTIAAERLRGLPDPDILLSACRRLGVEPQHTAVFETSPDGVAAAHSGGFGLVVAVDRAGQSAALRACGADLVVNGLAEILDRNLASRPIASRGSGSAL